MLDGAYMFGCTTWIPAKVVIEPLSLSLARELSPRLETWWLLFFLSRRYIVDLCNTFPRFELYLATKRTMNGEGRLDPLYLQGIARGGN